MGGQQPRDCLRAEAQPAADGSRHLVLSGTTHARPFAHQFRPLLPQPRPAAGVRPASLAHGQRRRPRVCAQTRRVSPTCVWRRRYAAYGASGMACSSQPTPPSSVTIRWCAPATATRLWRSSATRQRRLKHRSSDPSVRRRTAPSSIPSGRFCHVLRACGRRGTTSRAATNWMSGQSDRAV